MTCLYCEKETAPQCEKKRIVYYPFCNNHYFAIPQRLRKFLWQGESAWQAALEWLESKYGKKENSNAN